MMSDVAWKRAERQLAKMFGSKRNGPLGTESPDFSTPYFDFEVKERKDKLPLWLTGAVEQSETNAAHGKMSAVILHVLGGEYEKDLVVLRVKDMRRMLDLLDQIIEE